MSHDGRVQSGEKPDRPGCLVAGAGKTMARTKSAVTQAELTRYAKAMRAAGYEDWHIEVDKPDGSQVRIVAGKAEDDEASADAISRLIDERTS